MIESLETSYDLQKLALGRLKADQLDSREKLEEAGRETSAVLGDFPPVSSPDLPSDLERELLGESSSSEAE